MKLVNQSSPIPSANESQGMKDEPLLRTNPDGGPLSFAQERLWFIDQLEPNRPLYNILVVARLTGLLGLDCLQQAVDRLVLRHDALRTRFVNRFGEPRLMVDETARSPLKLHDLTSFKRPDTEAKRLIQQEQNRPFNLEKDRLLRVLVLRLKPAEHLLVVIVHHIIADEWSLEVFFHELAASYQGYVQGLPVHLPELPMPYADYAASQREALQGEFLEKQLRFWTDELAGDLPMTELPADHCRAVRPSFRGRSISRQLSLELSQALSQFARKERATLFMVLLSAFKVLLYRWTQQSDLIVASPVAGRRRFETEGLVGLFVNTLALRTKLSGGLTFREALAQERQAVMRAYDHQDLPFEIVVRELHPERTLAHLPFTRLMFLLQNGAIEGTTWAGGLGVEFLETESETAKFDLTLVMKPTGRGIVARIEFDTDLFEERTILGLLEQLEVLLKSIVIDPGRRLAELPLLPPAEQRQVLLEWNATQTDYPREKCIHEIFEAQTAKTPEATAVVFGTDRLTYRELNERANGVAHLLEKFHIEPDQPVAICLESSVELVIALLAILKAGGAYVPLDPSYPKERMAFMLAEVATPVLLTQHSCLHGLPDNLPAMICLDQELSATGAARQNCPSLATADNLAYVMYTSGSTGQPKGVAVPHRAVVRLVLKTNYVELSPNDRVAQVSNISFDAATFEIWGALLNGGQVVGISREVMLAPKQFAHVLRERGITTMFLTSALFNQIASEIPGAFESLRTLIVGGDALDPNSVRAVLETRPPKRLLNGYGPTENATFTCCHLVKEVTSSATNIPIGRPISNTQVYLLDADRNPVPIGAAGEICIGGDGLARGYWKRPELTAEKFIGFAFAPEVPAQTLYRTGDLGRWLPDGTIEFLGRLDRQVKIRGFRVELGEIEVILGCHPAVRECVVVAGGKGPESRRLVAYVTARKALQPPTRDGLRVYLQSRLPDYMVPSVFVVLNALPLTPNGKVDRDALPDADATRPELEKKYRAPRDEIERQLVEIWEQALNVRPVGIADRFFDLGGHSLLAVRLAAEIEKVFGKRIQLATIFQTPTIERLAPALRAETNGETAKTESSLVEIQAGGSRPPLFLVHGAGGGMFWGYANLARHLGPDQPVYGFKSRGLEGQDEFNRIEEMAAHYLADLRSVQPHGPYYLGGYCFGGNVAFEMAQQLSTAGEKVAFLALLNCSAPNSGYNDAEWTPLWFGRFLRNLLHWAKYFARWRSSQRRAFFRWKWTLLKRRLTALRRSRGQGPRPVDVDKLVDLSPFTPTERKAWEGHIRAQAAYRLRPFAGRIHLFRSPFHPFWCSFAADYGWADVAQGGVEITTVPGAHEEILEEPCVGVVATELERLLRRGPIEIKDGPGTSSLDHEPLGGRATSRTEADPLVLSYVQERVWLLNQFEPGKPVYHLQLALRMTGVLRRETLQESLNALVRRHEVLRTIFPGEHGQPVARVLPPTNFTPRFVDLRPLEPAAREAHFAQFASELRNLAFDLATEMPIRAGLARLEEQEHMLILVLHEMVADEPSLVLLHKELCDLYAACCKAAPRLPPPRMQYSDFSARQRAEDKVRAWEPQVAFWRAQLRGAPEGLELPADRSRPPLPTYQAATEKCILAADLVEKLRGLCAQQEVAEETLFLATITLLLKRYGRQGDLLVGTPVDNRDATELKSLIGNFENLLILRVPLTDDPTVTEVLNKVQAVSAQARRHQDLPFARLIEELNPPRNQSYHPLFQIFYAFQTQVAEEIDAGGLHIRRMPLGVCTTKFDLAFRVKKSPAGIDLAVDYATDLFGTERIRRLAGHWQVLLDGMVANPAARISQLPILDAAEQNLLLRTWNDTQQDFPKEKTLSQLFEEQVARTPEAEALVSGQTRLTYRQLYNRAIQIAGQLRAMGIEQEALVGVCLERSWEMVAGILGTLLAGGAYVPLDPAYPRERLAFILIDTQARVVLTQKKLRAALPAGEARLVCLDEMEFEGCETQVSTPRWPPPEPANLAYVIYTSGSTGQPKGVALEHRSAVAFVYWAKTVFSPDELSGVLASTSICFDLSVFELFAPLSWGGKVILAENALALPTLPAAGEVKLINTVPSAIRELLRVSGVPPSVQVVNLAGEPLPTGLVDHIYRGTAVRKVYDLYGPSETTTYSTYTLRRVGAPASIGRPLANEQVYLLDGQANLVPIGVPGELYIGGAGLARGYFHQPDLTADRFVPNPFRSGQRLYRTGDLARWRSDGTLEFLGRIDHQIKIRGFRIELGEVEAVLKKDSRVSEVAVLAREDSTGDRRLVAYVVARAGQCVTAEELRQASQTRLPDYMVPPAFVFLETMPLTPNGKVDRKALPEPEQEKSGEGLNFVAPRTPAEEEVAAIWAEVLGLERIGVRDDFFGLGGHSLKAVQVLSRVQDAFKVAPPLTSLFEARTIEALVEALNSGQWKPTAQPLLTPQGTDENKNTPVSFVQERLWFLDQLAPGSHAYNVPAALRLRGELHESALQQTLHEIIRRHQTLRTTFQLDNGTLQQLVAPNLVPIIQLINLEAVPEPDKERRALAAINTEAQRPFDLSRGPLLRVSLVRLGSRDHALLVVMHHSICDGWSMSLFFRELDLLYSAFSANRLPPALPALPVQYADFARWQRQCMQGSVLEQELSYWKQSLNGAPATLNLPVDYRSESELSGKASHRSIQVPPELTADLSGLGQREGLTPFMLLLAALALTLNKWTGQKDLVIGTVVAGRNRKEVEMVIGCFMNFLPIRIRVPNDQTGAQFLTAVRKTVVESQAHQDCPFEKIVEAINPERGLNQNPLYNVALLLQNFPADLFGGQGLQTSRLPVAMEAALLDLRFEAEETAEGLSLTCEYRTNLFEGRTIEELLSACLVLLEALVHRPETPLAALKLSAALQNQAKAARAGEAQLTIAISATFTAEPLEASLGYWLKQIELPARIEFTPYNQVFQQLLDPASLFATNQRGLNLLLLRLEDWLPQDVKSASAVAVEALERNVNEFVRALKTAATRSSTPFLVSFCPPSSTVTAHPETAAFLGSQEQILASQLERLEDVYVLTAGELERWYPVADYFDPHGNELGHIPYKPLFFTSLAAAVARKFHALNRAPFKVIALDCDNTLWNGVCGEDGAMGVRIDGARQALQQFFRAQQEVGMLLCLCSKNNAEDVHEVFARRLEMPLRREHFAAERLNWQPKSQNLRSLAHELKLGLESFIFVDDNPVECAAVESDCPEVLTLQLPEDSESIPRFLNHCWAFDHLKLTKEDRQRSQMYRQQLRRDQFRAQAMSLKEFLEGLDLKVRIELVSTEQLCRVSQLALRTNQFNCTTRRRTEAELRQLLTHSEALAASVTDRFGDYGLVGVLIHQTKGRALDIDTFLLSCRVLGRGIEHRLLARLGQIALERRLEWVDVHFCKTEKNKPALEFLESVGLGFKQPLNGGYLYRFPARFAAELKFNPQKAEVASTHSNPDAALPSSTAAGLPPRFTRYRQLAVEAADPVEIHRQMEATMVTRSRRQTGYLAPRTELERKLCGLWQNLLHLEKVGVQDNFFDLGGHSLLAVRLFAEVAEMTGRKFPLVTLFQAPTIEELARVVCRQETDGGQSLLVPIQPEGSRPPLFLVHGAGGDVLWGYANLAAYLGKEQPVYGIKSRGQAGLQEFTKIEEMARHYLREVQAFQPQGPYFLGGYCFGGNVAYAMARELLAQGQRVALLALLDSAPANAGYESLMWGRPHFAFRFAANCWYWLGDFARLKPSDRHRFFARKLRAFGRKLLRRLRAQGESDPYDVEEVIDASHLPENELKLWQIHLQALTDHVEKTYPGRLTLFRTRGQPLFCSFEEDFCWSKVAQGGVSVKRIPGSHENIFMDPNVQCLAKELALSLADAAAKIENRGAVV